MKKVYLDNLPKSKRKSFKGKNAIDWKSSIGCNVKFEYNDIEGKFLITDYNPKKGKITLKYNGEIFEITTDGVKKCQLGRVLKIYTKEYRVNIGESLKNEKRDLTIIDRKIVYEYKKHRNKYYKYRCNVCGYEGWMLENSLIKGNQCRCCAKQIAVLGKNTIYDTDKWMIPYIGVENSKKYMHSSNKKIDIKCPYCGKTKKYIISKLYYNKSIGCDCSDGISYPNKLMNCILTQIGIDFESEKIFEWSEILFKDKKRKCRYDFYFKKDNIEYIIEMDGGFHYTDNSLNNQTLEESKYIDKEKDKIAFEHGIKVIRVDCYYNNHNKFDYIKNSIINSELNNILDFKCINWDKCNICTLDNLVYKACEIKNMKPNMTTTEIGKEIGVNKQTIIKYLKQGNSIGLCKYNAKDEMIRSGKKSKNRSRCNLKYKKIYQYTKEKILTRIWDLEIEKIDNKYNINNIYRCIKGERKTHKGYIWSNKRIV